MLGFPWSTLTYVLYYRGPESYYKTWEIKKKAGGTRQISAPTSTLYWIQKALHDILQDSYRPRPAAHGFVRTRSIVSNATKHINRRFVFNIDIEDFFPSINFGRVRGLFVAPPFECQADVATVIAQICCMGGALPIGAPTSPVISNMICLRMDKELQKLARAHGCWYSRYADDISFSTGRNRFPEALARSNDSNQIVLGDDLVRIIRSNGFSPNILKTRLQTRDDRQLVTGVVVNEKLNVDRRYVRRVRAMIHSWHKHGLTAAEDHMKKWYMKDRFPGASPEFLDVLKGRISYLAMVRGPNDPLARRFADQFDNLKAGRDLNHGIDYELSPSQAASAPQAPGRKQLLTIMFTDIVNSTMQSALVGDDRWRVIREKHDRLVRSQLKRHRGREIKTMGDGFLITFDNPTEAVHCAHAIIANLEGIEVRIGIHTGEIGMTEGDVEGIGVSISARVVAEAHSSEVLVSQTLRDLLSGSGFVFKNRGRHKLKGVPGKVRLFAVRTA